LWCCPPAPRVPWKNPLELYDEVWHGQCADPGNGKDDTLSSPTRTCLPGFLTRSWKALCMGSHRGYKALATGLGQSPKVALASITTSVLCAVSFTTNRSDRLHKARSATFRQRTLKGYPNHSHPGCASLRAQASQFLDELSATVGARRFDLSIAPRETKRGIAGQRLFRTPKDLLSDPQWALVEQSDLITMVDTDYYLSMSDLSAYAGHDIAMYTLQPDALAGTGPESSWRFTSPTTVVEDVKGGASYTHQVWDWGKDLVVLSGWLGTYIYDPVLYEVGRGRYVVLLLLARTIRLPLWAADWLIPGLKDHQPSRMRVVEKGGYLVGMFGDPGHRKVQLLDKAFPDVAPIEVMPDDWQSLRAMAVSKDPDQNTGSGLLPSGVERYFKARGIKMPLSAAYAITSYFKGSVAPLDLVSYQARDGLDTEVGVSGLVQAAPCPVGAGAGPASSQNNLDRAIATRVQEVENKESFSPDMQKYAQEFVNLCVGKHAGKLVPWSYAEVCKQQSRPAQKARRLVARMDPLSTSKTLSTKPFMKLESGPSVGDPRAIFQVTADQTTNLSMYTLAASEHLKRLRFYATGKNPQQLALALRNVHKHAKAGVVGGDYSRMDGRTSVDYRKFVADPIMVALFAAEYKGLLIDLLEREHVSVGAVPSGKTFKSNGGNMSGSPITGILNGLDSGFNEYAARRVSQPDLTPAQCFNSLGLYFGDDSSCDGSVFSAMADVAEQNGMKLTREEVPEGAPPGYVVFLSRVYPDISTSDVCYPKIVRALKKLCVVRQFAGDKDKHKRARLALKAEAAVYSYGRVPLYGSYASALIRVFGGSGAAGEEVLRQDHAFAKELRLTRELAPRTGGVGEWDLCVGSISMDLGIPPSDVLTLDKCLRACKCYKELVCVKLEGFQTELPDWAVWVA